MKPLAIKQRWSAWLASFKVALQSRESLLKFLETKESSTRTESGHRNIWKNEDLDISPPSDWTWAWYDYAAFWWSYGFSVGVWSLGSSMISIGLNYWQAIICVFLGHLLGAIGIVLHSRSAAQYHFGFPVESRVSWGLRGAYFPVFVRVLVGTIWNGLAVIEGGYFVSIFLRCLFGDSFYRMHNPIPLSADITIQDLIGMLIFWIATLPILYVRPTKVKIIFSIKSFILPPITIGLFIYCMLKGRGSTAGSFQESKVVRGSALAWAMLSAVNSTMGKTASLIVNQPDLARYARTPSAPMLSQFIALIVGNTACATLGIFATSSIYHAWGVLKWNPWDLSNLILDREWNSGTRAGIAIVSLGFMLSVFSSNLGANLIPWGADTTVMLPRFINIRRGMYISYVIAICICPWHILKSATTFLRFLGGYSVFLGPMVGIFVTDYFVIRKGNIWVESLYDPNGRYWYWHGYNWRAFASFVVAVILPIPGFAALFGHDLPVVWTRIYDVGWLIGCVLSSFCYFALCFVGDFATEEKNMGFEETVGLHLCNGSEVGNGETVHALESVQPEKIGGYDL